MKDLIKIVLMVVIAVSGAALVGFYASRFNPEKPTLMGQSAPLFEAPAVREGPKFVLQEALGSKYLLVNFWATWCAPCREEMPLLNQLAKGVSSDKLQIVALMEDDLPSREEYVKELDRFEKRIPLAFPVYYDRYSQIADDYSTYKIPETYLIAPDGKVVKHVVGSMGPTDRDEIIKIISQ